MTHIDEVIATYLSAIETEGKAARTIKAYREALADFRRVGHRLGLPETAEQYEVSPVARRRARWTEAVERLSCVAGSWRQDRLVGE